MQREKTARRALLILGLALLALFLLSFSLGRYGVPPLTVIPRVDAPSKMARAAPKAAPLEAPRMSGEAMGLWNTP